MVLNRYGYHLETATKDKDSGIIEINRHLLGPNNEPSLFVFSDMVRTIKEFEGWMWDEDPANRGKAQKRDDDFMECLYRLLLLDTYWYPMEDEDNEYDEPVAVNTWTGY
jgi:hypothetical protein